MLTVTTNMAFEADTTRKSLFTRSSGHKPATRVTPLTKNACSWVRMPEDIEHVP